MLPNPIRHSSLLQQTPLEEPLHARCILQRHNLCNILIWSDNHNRALLSIDAILLVRMPAPSIVVLIVDVRLVQILDTPLPCHWTEHIRHHGLLGLFELRGEDKNRLNDSIGMGVCGSKALNHVLELLRELQVCQYKLGSSFLKPYLI